MSLPSPRTGRFRVAPYLLAASAPLALLQWGCSHRTLGKPVFMGASATAGVGAAATDGDGGELPVDLAVAYDAVVVASHEEPRRLGDGLFYQRPEDAARDQIEVATRERASIVFAIDWLFWPAYAPVPSSAADTTGAAGSPADDQEVSRIDRVRKALDLLAVYDATRTPLVIGDVPALGGPAGVAGRAGVASADIVSDDAPATTAIARRGVPDADEIAAMNQCIAEWAAQRPWVIVLPLNGFMAGTGVAADGSPLLQPDGLHPTAAGLLLMVQESMRRLSANGLVAARDWRPDVASNDPALVVAAERSLDTPSAGWLDKAAVYLAYKDLGDALQAQPPECDRASRAASRLFEMAPRLDKDPTGFGLGAMLAADSARACMEACPDTAPQVRRCVERLGFDIRRASPNPFRLSLWTELALLLGAEDEVVRRALALSHEAPANLDDYDDTLDRVEHLLRESPRGDAPASATRRAKVVALRGGPDALLARGRGLLDGLGDPTAHLARLGAEGVRAGNPPAVGFPPSTADAKWNERMLASVVLVQALLDDLDAAAQTGDRASADAAESLRSVVEDRLGTTGRGAALGLRPSLANRVQAPSDGRGWAFVAWGTLDDDVRRRWLEGADDASVAVDADVVRIRRLFEHRSTLADLLAMAPTHVVGQVGDFDAATGVLTILDGEAVVTECAGSTSSAEAGLTSRTARPTDPRRQSIRAGVTGWSATPIADAGDLAALERAMWQAAAQAGFDMAQPVPVRVEGEFETLDLRVDRAGPPPAAASSQGEARPMHAPAEPARFAIGPRRAVLTGFIAPWALGTIVRPERVARLHAVWTDEAGRRHTAEVEGLGGGRSLQLSLPAPTSGPTMGP